MLYKLLKDGKVILRGTYRQCVIRRFEMRRADAACFNSLVIVPDDTDPDGFTGYSL